MSDGGGRFAAAHTALQIAIFIALGSVLTLSWTTAPPTPPAPMRAYISDEESVKHAMASVVDQRRGVFANKAARPDLNNTVVVTMANWGFREFFMNWACFADAMGMDFMVLAADRKLHTYLGAGRSVLLADVGEKQEWGTSGYYDLGCRKIEAVRYVVELGYNILFTDADNVIGRIPEQLLKEISEGQYDALIQADHPDCKSREDCPFKWKAGKTANGGFYYFSAARKHQVSEMLGRAYDYCMAKPRTKTCCDDQQAVNKAIHEVMETAPAVGVNGFPGAEFCAYENGGRPAGPDNLQFCVMDPEAHPAGRHAINHDKLVSFHANWILEGKRKVERLSRLGLWQWVGEMCRGEDAYEA